MHVDWNWSCASSFISESMIELLIFARTPLPLFAECCKMFLWTTGMILSIARSTLIILSVPKQLTEAIYSIERRLVGGYFINILKQQQAHWGFIIFCLYSIKANAAT